MSVEELLQYVPQIARYRREPLDDRENALSYWDDAAAGMVRLDDALYDELVGDDPDAWCLSFSVGEANIDRFRQFLENNRRTFELLHVGVRCDLTQFPELEEKGGSFSEHAESMDPLTALAQAWSILAQSRIIDGDLTAAVSELVGLGQMGHIICCGEGLVMHYLVGSGIMDSALADICKLVAGHHVPATALEELSAAIERWIVGADDVAQCLRVDLCSYSLREIDRLAECSGIEARVDGLLDRHYANEPILDLRDEQTDETDEDDGRLAWRRERILYLLEGHPAPFDTIATVRLMGQLVADYILDLEPSPWYSLGAQWGRVKRTYRRSRFRSRNRHWPSQLSPSFLYEHLGPSEDALRNLAELKEHLPTDKWNQLKPPTDEQLDAARERIRAMPNALGILVADALLAVNIAPSEHRRRRQLLAAKAAVSDVLATASE
ncbi:MAG: hypothetical protein H8E44_38280 [Planctomycetes bacterium]|nr:hypothetical protein [Planctomycetota bacterium]